jgi:hypothetical protein
MKQVERGGGGGGGGALGKNLATSNEHVVVRNVAHLEVVGAHA